MSPPPRFEALRSGVPTDLLRVLNSARVTPGGPPVTVPPPDARPPVMCRVVWSDGITGDVPGFAHAWTRDAVLVCVRDPRHPLQHLTWLAAGDVRWDR